MNSFFANYADEVDEKEMAEIINKYALNPQINQSENQGNHDTNNNGNESNNESNNTSSVSDFRAKLNLINSMENKINKFQKALTNIKNDLLTNQVQYLKTVKQYTQKTKEWHDVRRQMFTASSDVCSILNKSKYTGLKQTISKKINDSSSFKGNKYTQFGNKYERIGIQIYESRYNKTVEEFGLLSHPTIAWLGASPDGITTDGRLVEIKVPYTRQLTGAIETQYFVQIQTQMEVCDLDVCDFFECKITEYFNKQQYDNDQFNENEITFLDIIPKTTDLNFIKVPDNRRTQDGLEKGMIGRIGTWTTSDTNEYIYPPMHWTSIEQYEWLMEKKKKFMDEQDKVMHIDYWKLETSSYNEVPRDREWWKNNQVEAKLANAWKQVEEAKSKQPSKKITTNK